MIRYKLAARRTVLKTSEATDPDALHVIVPHCVNWQLTSACVDAFRRLTSRKLSITVVNNFDTVPTELALLSIPNLTLISHEWTAPGKLWLALRPTRHGSKENALALDAAMQAQPRFSWAFMAHTDSAPLIAGWERYFFEALDGGRIIGNYRDSRRIHAAHASGTLFHQESLVRGKVSLRPVYKGGEQVLDVGDRATAELHPGTPGTVPVLPNTWNDPSLIPELERRHALLASLARDGSTISLDPKDRNPVFGHLGRGTPRSMKDPTFAHKLPQDVWIELINSIG